MAPLTSGFRQSTHARGEAMLSGEIRGGEAAIPRENQVCLPLPASWNRRNEAVECAIDGGRRSVRNVISVFGTHCPAFPDVRRADSGRPEAMIYFEYRNEGAEGLLYVRQCRTTPWSVYS